MLRRGGAALFVLVALVGGCSSDDGDAADVSEPTEPLVAAFSAQPNLEVTGPTSCPLRDIDFTDESTGDPEAWHWEFSDGSTSEEQNPVVTNRVFEATLTVSRGDDEDSVTQAVSIADC